MKRLIKEILIEHKNRLSDEDKKLFMFFFKSMFNREFKIKYDVYKDNDGYIDTLEYNIRIKTFIINPIVNKLLIYLTPLEEIEYKYDFKDKHYDIEEDDFVNFCQRIETSLESYGIRHFDISVYFDKNPPKRIRKEYIVIGQQS